MLFALGATSGVYDVDLANLDPREAASIASDVAANICILRKLCSTSIAFERKGTLGRFLFSLYVDYIVRLWIRSRKGDLRIMRTAEILFHMVRAAYQRSSRTSESEQDHNSAWLIESRNLCSCYRSSVAVDGSWHRQIEPVGWSTAPPDRSKVGYAGAGRFGIMDTGNDVIYASTLTSTSTFKVPQGQAPAAMGRAIVSLLACYSDYLKYLL